MSDADAAIRYPEDDGLAGAADWRTRAAAIEARIADAARAIDELRELLAALAPALQRVGALDAALRNLAKPPSRPRPVVPLDEARPAPATAPVRPPRLEAVTPTPRGEESAAEEGAGGLEAEDDPQLAELRRAVEEAKRQARGFDALPRTYFLTFEDRTRSVDLIPIDRALSSLDGLSEVSLQRYSEGKAMISVRSAGELPLRELERAVGTATGRRCTAEAIDEFTVLVSLLDESGEA
ncbi:MAG TPA: hypothetical protein VNM43_09200 [Dehalococcoidia bacterium]|nr:hypothetical protein [Dehalococcoidia bacterium]